MVKSLLPVLSLPARALLLGIVVSASALAGGSPAQAFIVVGDPSTVDAVTADPQLSNPYITLQGVTYGSGSGGNSNFQEFNKINGSVELTGASAYGLWENAKSGDASVNFWNNSGNNPVLNLRIGANDYLGVVSRQYKTSGNVTQALQWAPIDPQAWYSNSQISAAASPETYLLWLSGVTPLTGNITTSSDPITINDLNTILAAQRAAGTTSDPAASTATEGVPAPLPLLLGPVMVGFLPKLRRFRLEQRQATIA